MTIYFTCKEDQEKNLRQVYQVDKEGEILGTPQRYIDGKNIILVWGSGRATLEEAKIVKDRMPEMEYYVDKMPEHLALEGAEKNV